MRSTIAFGATFVAEVAIDIVWSEQPGHDARRNVVGVDSALTSTERELTSVKRQLASVKRQLASVKRELTSPIGE